MNQMSSELYNFALDAEDKNMSFGIDAFLEMYLEFEPDNDTLHHYYAQLAAILDPMDFYIADLKRQDILDDIYASDDFEEIDRMVRVGRDIDAIIDNDYDSSEPIIYFDDDAHEFLPVSYNHFITKIENKE